MTRSLQAHSGGNDEEAGYGPLIANPLEAADGHHGYSSPRGDGADNLIVADTLSAGSHPGSNMPGRRREDDTNLVGFSHTQGLDAQPSFKAWPSLRREGGGQAVGNGSGVRRLTPIECERLQAWPDGWTNPDGTAPDSRRYAACGDGVTATVSEWIGRRILASALSPAEAAV